VIQRHYDAIFTHLNNVIALHVYKGLLLQASTQDITVLLSRQLWTVEHS